MNRSDTKENLANLGLSDGEITVYLALLEQGKSPVKTIKETTDLHRTSIYDFVDSLIDQGLVSYTKENHKKHFQATQPSKLQQIIDDKQRSLNAVIDNLQELYNKQKTELEVEILKGREGVKTFLNEIIQKGEDYQLLGVDEAWWTDEFPILTKQHFKREAEAGITWRGVASYDETVDYEDYDLTNYRFINQHRINSLNTVIYGDTVAIILEEPTAIILIRNADLAEAHQNHFNILWEQATQHSE